MFFIVLLIAFSVVISAVVAALAIAVLKKSDPKDGDYAIHSKLPKVTWNDAPPSEESKENNQ